MNRMPAFRSVLALAIILLVPLMAVPGSAWHGSGSITALAIDPHSPNTLYAGTDSGVFKSTDGGASWSATSLTGIYIGALAVDPQTPTTLYAGAYHPWTVSVDDSGVFKSTDGGTTWTGSLLSGVYVEALAIDPQTPTTLYAGGLWYAFWDPEGYYYYENVGGVFKSMDGGATWGVPALSDVRTLAIDPVTPSTVYAGGYDFNYVKGVFKSTDGGASWSATGLTGIYIVDLAIDPVTPSTVYASGHDFNYVKGVFKSTDGGATWSATGLTELIWDLAIDPQTPTTLYAGGGPYKSTDGGATWSIINTGLTDVLLSYGVFPAVGALAIEPLTPTTDPNQPLAVYGGTSIGVFKSRDGGASWTPTGLFQHSPLASVSLNPTTVVGGTASTGTVILVSAAPAGGVAITLSSSNTAVATVPSSVTVPEGATSADFTITTSSVTDYIWVWIRASFDDATRSAGLTVNPVSPPDTEPPDTSITSAVDGNGASVPNDGVTLSNAITLAFSGTDNVKVAEFECRLDGATFTSCPSPVTYSGLAVGPHDFEVRAVDTANNRDGTPAAYTWTVDSPPETTITSALDRQGNPIPNGGLTRSSQITFSFTGTDNVSVTGFECSLDGAAFTPCTSPITYVGGGRGTHTFRVRAIDNNGFRDPTPAAFTWTR